MNDTVGLNYTVQLKVFAEGDMHVRAFKTDFDIDHMKPEEKRRLLSRIAAALADEIGHEMFPMYRPSQTEVLEEEWYRMKMEREKK